MEFLRKIRIELMIFLLLFVTYSYFYQGGGSGQNSRFDQVRSIVEGRRLEINNYLAYRFVPDSEGRPKLRRLPVSPGIELEKVARIANTGDIVLFDGRFYPNKPPGTVFVAIPAYLTIYQIERFLGIDPDNWWALTINLYLTTVFSVGLLAALGGVAFYRISLRLFALAPAWSHAASTLTFGMGTLVLPFATTLFDHDMVAALSLFSFWLLLGEKEGSFKSVRSSLVFLLAGVLAGLTVLMSYTAVITVGLLILYVVWVTHSPRKTLLFLAGSVLPLALLAWYHMVCFGSVFAIANTYQNETFQDQEMLLFGMFGIPQFDVTVKLLFSSYRGLFFTSPVLALSFFGFWLMANRYRKYAELSLCASVFFSFLIMNSAFNHWHSGWSIGPRYLIPALPFLSLPLTPVFKRLPRTTLAVAAVSAVVMLLATAVDPQPPSGIQSPLIEYVLPMLQGKTMMFSGLGRGYPLMQGPVSANPLGIYESWYYPVFHPGIIQRQWNSFNLGEFIWAGSLISLLPLCCVLVLGLGALGYWSRQSVTDAPEPLMSTR